MKTADIIEGLTILQKYRDKQDGYDVDAAHDELYVRRTDRPLSQQDLTRMVELHWFQEGAEYDSDDGYAVENYDPIESWNCFT